MGGCLGGEWNGKAEVRRTCHRSKLLVRTGTFPAASSWGDSSPSFFEREFRAGGRKLDRTCVTEQRDKDGWSLSALGGRVGAGKLGMQERCGGERPLATGRRKLTESRWRYSSVAPATCACASSLPLGQV